MGMVSFINRENLRVARENIVLNTTLASKKVLNSKKDSIAKWESGESLPTWLQVSKMAKVYNVPEALFFSDEKIRKSKTIPDYRVGSSEKNDEKIKALINLVVTRQKWLERELKDAGWTPNRLMGSGTHLKSPKDLAGLITEKLDIDLAEIKKISSRKDTLNYLIQRAENCGIFVGKTVSYHRLKVEDLRGLFISNNYCPFIVLNRRDTFSAQIFSFIHELAHFFRKSDSISNSLEFRNINKNINPEEVFCNRVVIELLLPEKRFEKKFYTKNDIDFVSMLYKVSSLSVFYRLKDLGMIKQDIESSLERDIKREIDENLNRKAEEDANKEGGNYIYAMKDSNGDLFNNIVSSSYLENKIGYVEATNLLRFSPEVI